MPRPCLSPVRRDFHRVLSVLRVARSPTDLDGEANVASIHIAKALSYRAQTERATALA
jgi:magnesium chelatase family protein